MGRYATGWVGSWAPGFKRGMMSPRLKEEGGEPVVPKAVKRWARRGAQQSFPTLHKE